jgi:hypothetical protein
MSQCKTDEQIRSAIKLALDGDWIAAHKVVQTHENNPKACLVHAILHKIEGDKGNAQYWYRRSGVDWNDQDPKDELEKLLK